MLKKEHTKLYLRNSQNKLRFWEIYITEENNIYYIHHHYGIVDGKITSPLPRKMLDLKKAITKVNAEIKKKRLFGFSENPQTNIIRGSIIGPMGAHKLDDFEKKLVYPVMVQKKYDGFRCFTHIDKNGVVTLYSKSMKPFTHLHHIKLYLENWAKTSNTRNIYLDGELYNHDLKLNEISSIVMKKRDLTNDEKNREKIIQYMLFDVVLLDDLSTPFSERYDFLKKLFKKNDIIKVVECEIAKNKESVYKLNDSYLLDGYEGVIVRNKNGLYLFKKKSYDVLRTKEFKHGIFIIIDGKEGSGSYSNTIVWKLQCNKKSSSSFHAIQLGTLQERQNIYKSFTKNPDNFIGKKVKVKYLSIDSNGCVLRNPIVTEIL